MLAYVLTSYAIIFSIGSALIPLLNDEDLFLGKDENKGSELGSYHKVKLVAILSFSNQCLLYLTSSRSTF
jgi:hypothetical protein